MKQVVTKYFVQYRERNVNSVWNMELQSGYDSISDLLIDLVLDNSYPDNGFDEWEYHIVRREIEQELKVTSEKILSEVVIA